MTDDDASTATAAWALKRNSEGPFYRQIAEDLARKIQTGELAPAQQVPTESELMEGYGASRNTVRDAVKLLITRGLEITRAGQGTFVAEKIVPFVSSLTGDPATGHGDVYEAAVRASMREPRSSPPRIEVQAAEGQIASELKVPVGSPVVSRHQQRFINETPWSLQTSFYPLALVQQGADGLLQPVDIPEGVVVYLAKKLGIKQAGYRDQIKYRTPDPQETAFFGLPQDGRIGVFSILRTGFDADGKPIRLTITVYPADRNQFAIEVGDVPPPEEGGSGPS